MGCTHYCPPASSRNQHRQPSQGAHFDEESIVHGAAGVRGGGDRRLHSSLEAILTLVGRATVAQLRLHCARCSLRRASRNSIFQWRKNIARVSADAHNSPNVIGSGVVRCDLACSHNFHPSSLDHTVNGSPRWVDSTFSIRWERSGQQAEKTRANGGITGTLTVTSHLKQ